MAMNVGNMIRRELRRRVPAVAKLESKSRRYTGKGLNNLKLPGNAQLPKGFKAPRGTKLVVPDGAEVPPDTDEVTLDDPDDANGSKKLFIIIGIVMVASLLVVLGFVFVPRGLDWWQDRNSDDTTTTEAPTTTTTITPVTTTTLAPVLVTTWDVGSCVTTAADGSVSPSSCEGADLTVTAAVAYPDDPLTSDEISEAQQILADLGVIITVDGVILKQTRTALDAATLAAGRPIDVGDRVKLAIVRSLSIPDGLDPEGPRIVRMTPAVCGDGIGWIESPDEALCLEAR